MWKYFNYLAIGNTELIIIPMFLKITRNIMKHKYIENTCIIKFHLRNYRTLRKRKYSIQNVNGRLINNECNSVRTPSLTKYTKAN